MKETFNGNFESDAERKAYSYIKKIAEQLNYDLTIQLKITDWDYKDWVQEKFDCGDWDESDADEYERETGNCCTYSFQKYRIDFALQKLIYGKDCLHCDKIAIEIDGEKYHDAYNDAQKDLFLTERGWKVLRIKAKEVYNWKIKDVLNKFFNLGQRNINYYVKEKEV